MAIQFGKGKATSGKSGGTGAPAGKKSGAAKGGQVGASLLPEDWVSGGLLNDVDVDIKEMIFVDDWNYGGTIETPILALRVTFGVEDGEDVVQHYSAGDLSRYVPSENGDMAVPADNSNAKGLSNNCNATQFIASIIDAGFPKNLVSQSVTVFEGTNVHVNRIEQKKRKGIVNQDDKTREVLLVTKINRLPNEAKGKATKAVPSKGAAKATATSAAASNGEADLTDEAAALIAQVLEDKNGTVAFKGLSMASLKHLAGNENRAGIIALLKDADFIVAAAEGTGAFEFDGDTLTAA